jgi:streptogramin lyase
MSRRTVRLADLEFKSIALLVDKKDRIWLHDAITRALIIFDSGKMAEIKRFEGKIINLCTWV